MTYVKTTKFASDIVQSVDKFVFHWERSVADRRAATCGTPHSESLVMSAIADAPVWRSGTYQSKFPSVHEFAFNLGNLGGRQKGEIGITALAVKQSS